MWNSSEIDFPATVVCAITLLVELTNAVVTLHEVLESGALPSNFSAQAAELVALSAACRLGKDKKVTIWTDSQYAFSTLFTFAQQWRKKAYAVCAVTLLAEPSIRCESGSNMTKSD